jgi:STAND-like protein
MDPFTALGVAVNVLDIVNLSVQVSAILVKYIKDVKDAPADIARLRTEVDNTHSVLSNLNKLLESPDRHKLEASRNLVNALENCETQLKIIKERLPLPNEQALGNSKDGLKERIKKWTKLSSKQAKYLQWPLKSTQVNDMITLLQQNTKVLFQALQIDET